MLVVVAGVEAESLLPQPIGRRQVRARGRNRIRERRSVTFMKDFLLR
jgi:hypothetical protein